MSMIEEIADAGVEYDRKIREILQKHDPDMAEDAEDTHLIDRKIISLVATITYNFDEGCHDTVMELFRRRLMVAWEKKRDLMSIGMGADKWRMKQ